MQAVLQTPFEQTSPAPQVAPHAPQLAGSSFVSTQSVPHVVVPPPHDRAHVPSEQTSPVAHAWLHEPQFVTSWDRLVHAPPHDVWAFGHAVVESGAGESKPVEASRSMGDASNCETDDESPLQLATSKAPQMNGLTRTSAIANHRLRVIDAPIQYLPSSLRALAPV